MTLYIRDMLVTQDQHKSISPFTCVWYYMIIDFRQLCQLFNLRLT